MTKVKAFKIGIIIVGSAIVASALYYYIRLSLLYKKISTVEEATQDIQTQNAIVFSTNESQINESIEAAANDQTYEYDGESDWLDAVMINGNIYIGDANSGIYYSETNADDFYNANNDILAINGQQSTIPASSVQFGSIDENNSFIAD